MDDDALLRYSRQIMLPEIDIEGQEKLAAARVLIIGLGGLGSPVALYLAAAGVGHLTLVDFDTVDLSNLQRQIVHTTERIGMLKVESARETLQQLNPLVTVTTRAHKLTGAELDAAVAAATVVVDACDNLSSRLQLSDACVRAGKPLVSGAAIRLDGQVLVYNPARPEAACYRCLYGNAQEQAETCAQSGVIAPLLGIIGSIQALETLKLIVGFGDVLDELLLLDARNLEWQRLRIKKNPACHEAGRCVRLSQQHS